MNLNWIKKHSYDIALHLSLVALMATVVILSIQNAGLKESKSRIEYDHLAAGDTLWLEKIQETMDGTKPVDLQAVRVVVLITVDCPYCRQNIRAWNHLANNLDSKESMLGISFSAADDTKEYVKVNQIDFPVVTLPSIEEFKKRNKTKSVPKTIVKNASGLILGVWNGTLLQQHEEEIASLSRSASYNQP